MISTCPQSAVCNLGAPIGREEEKKEEEEEEEGGGLEGRRAEAAEPRGRGPEGDARKGKDF